MKLNTDKSKYMVVNYTDNYQFDTRLMLNDTKLEKVRETKLLGVVINEKLTWHSNTDFIVKKSVEENVHVAQTV